MKSFRNLRTLSSIVFLAAALASSGVYASQIVSDIEEGNIQKVKEFYQKEENDIDEILDEDSGPTSALTLAVIEDNEDMINEILKFKPNVNLSVGGGSALTMYVLGENPKVEILKNLINAGGNINETAYVPEDPGLYYDESDYEDYGYHNGPENLLMLHLGKNGVKKDEIVKYLINRGININFRNRLGSIFKLINQHPYMKEELKQKYIQMIIREVTKKKVQKGQFPIFSKKTIRDLSEIKLSKDLMGEENTAEGYAEQVLRFYDSEKVAKKKCNEGLSETTLDVQTIKIIMEYMSRENQEGKSNKS